MSVTEISFHNLKEIKAEAHTSHEANWCAITFFNKYDESVELTLFGPSGVIHALAHCINAEFPPVPQEPAA
jgi:hypothetical protein